jgi:hypothetical protein
LGILSGTFLNPSISSEKQIIFDSIDESNVFSANLTIEVLATSPKVPMCGNPDGPYPVSNTISFLFFSSRLIIFLASSKGHDLLSVASAIKDLFMNSLDTIDSLIYTMTLSAATDGDISDKEINTINFLFTTLPIFKNSNNDYLSKKMIECMELTKEEDNFENLIDLINDGLNSNKELKKTAYILALEIMMADLNIADESIRFLEILGLSLNLDNLEISSMKHTIRSKYAEDES